MAQGRRTILLSELIPPELHEDEIIESLLWPLCDHIPDCSLLLRTLSLPPLGLAAVAGAWVVRRMALTIIWLICTAVLLLVICSAGSRIVRSSPAVCPVTQVPSPQLEVCEEPPLCHCCWRNKLVPGHFVCVHCRGWLEWQRSLSPQNSDYDSTAELDLLTDA